jgi:hypothetical protein
MQRFEESRANTEIQEKVPQDQGQHTTDASQFGALVADIGLGHPLTQQKGCEAVPRPLDGGKVVG